jgi:tellurite resistance protein TerC
MLLFSDVQMSDVISRGAGEGRPLRAATGSVPGGDLHVPGWAWLALLAFVVALILVDLFVFHREANAVTVRAASIGSTVWITIGLSFSIVLWLTLGGDAAGQYLTGYAIEKSLSVDNVFVWAVIFGYFRVPREFQHRVLFWGIFGALVLRAAFIFAGVAIITRFAWVEYLFGAFLVYTAIKLTFRETEDVDPEHNPIYRWARRILPVTEGFRGHRLTLREHGKRMVTPLFLVLLVVEMTDVLFAVDSVPAVLSVSRSQFIVFSSNAFAILGLRALYFLLVGASDVLVHLDKGLGVILAFVGAKMLLHEVLHIDTLVSLGVIAVVLAVTVVVSLRSKTRSPEPAVPDSPRRV